MTEHMLLRNKIQYVKKKRTYYYKVIKQYSVYLKPGCYRLFYEDSKYVWKNAGRFEWLHAVCTQGIIRFIKMITAKNRIRIACTVNLLGDELLITRMQKVVKIFDRCKGIVTSFYPDEEGIKVADRFRCEYAPFFGGSTILNTDYEHLCITEKLIADRKGWREDEPLRRKCIEWMMDGLTNYMRKVEPTAYISVEELIRNLDTVIRENVKDKAFSVKMLEMVRFIEKELSGFLNERIPTVPIHGDFLFSNVLFDGVQFSLIDYEYYQDSVFFFDALYWFVFEAWLYKNMRYLDEYCLGKYDKWLETIFACEQYKYQKEDRKVYIWIVFLADYYMRVVHGETIQINEAYFLFGYLKKD